ncbi:unnamed protein product [Camellia sinensis]
MFLKYKPNKPEVGPDTPLRLRLLTGTAEIFGTEIASEFWLTFPPRLKFAVYTWYGATVEMDGTTETDYTADETPMISYVNVHAVLEGRRNRAKASPNDSDSSQDLYKVLMKELAQTLERQFAGNAEFRAAGMVINTMGWIEGVGYELLLHAIDAFNANVVLVLGQEKLCSMLNDVLKNKPNVDVVSRNAKVRQKARSYRIRNWWWTTGPTFSPANWCRACCQPYMIGTGPNYFKRKKITYLAPSAGELPSRFLIVGTLTWLET